jgi:colanic acid biosynthesis glycosyl transferase WcaI
MHILFINQYFCPDPASTGQLLTDLATGLSESHRVTVVTGFPSYVRGENHGPRLRLCATEHIGNVRVIRTFTTGLSRRSSLGRIMNYISFLCSSLIGALLVAGTADVVATMTDPPVIGLVGYLVSRIRRARFIFISQDVFPEVSQVLGVMNVRPLVRMLDILNRFLLRKSDGVVAIGETMRSRLIQKGADPAFVTVIENWADTDLISPADRVNPFSLRNDLCGRFVVMHSGNVGLSQDLETLIETADLMRSDTGVEFVIVGDGVSKPALQEKVDNLSLANVRFVPYQDREALRFSLAAADVSVVSLKPGLAGYIVPSKIYGILASARPVLAAVDAECEVARIVTRAGCGVVIEPRNPPMMVHTIRCLMSSSDLLAQYGSNARSAAELRYSRHAAVHRYADLIEEVHKTGRPPRRTKEEDQWKLQTDTL